ncbi:MAG TPA: RNA methyltransferase [Candidatus Omnitrophota bacterium]|nr:RNA methyltransferase [Candidatus Omnitrophota bacterium]
MAKVYLALIHFPVYNKNKQIVSTCITGVDLHDIARSALTYGISKYFVVNPMPAQLAFAKRIVDCWRKDSSFSHNWTRAEAFRLVELAPDLESVIKKLKNPVVVATSARPEGTVRFEKFRSVIKKSRRPVLILLGTGWGMTKELLDRADHVLEPICGPTDYNHLSVRSAAAVILDRLLGVSK